MKEIQLDKADLDKYEKLMGENSIRLMVLLLVAVFIDEVVLRKLKQFSKVLIICTPAKKDPDSVSVSPNYYLYRQRKCRERVGEIGSKEERMPCVVLHGGNKTILIRLESYQN